MEVAIKFKNLDKIKRAFQKAPALVTAEIGTAIQKTALMVERDAKKNAPVNKESGGGNLRQSIVSRMTGKASAVVEVGVKYGVFVHEGTAPHIITPVRAKVLANKRTGQFFGKMVRHPGTKANPFLKKALDMNIGFLNRELINIANAVFRKMF